MNIFQPGPALVAAALLLGACPVWAGPGHDEGQVPAAAGVSLPRFAAVSEQFELVGVLDGRRLALYLDRAADNSPVREARIVLEIDGRKPVVQVTREDAAVYEAVLEEALPAGLLPVTVEVAVGNESDLLAGEIDLHAQPHAARTGLRWRWLALAAGVAVLAGLSLLYWRLRGRRVHGLKPGGVA